MIEYKKDYGLKEAAIVGLFLSIILAFTFYDVIFQGKTLRISDTSPTVYPHGHYEYPPHPLKSIPVYDNTPAVLEEPYQHFKTQSLTRGVFPLWNPYQAGGYPFLATMESSLLFFPEIVIYLFPPPINWDVYILFRLLLAGIFTYGFMRVLRVEALPSFTSAIVYMLSGPMLSWMTNVTINADCMLPLFLMVTEMLLRKNSKILVTILSLVTFQAIAAGHPEHTFFLFLTGSLYICFRIFTKGFHYERTKVIVNFAVALGCGFLLSSVLLFPFAEYFFFNSWNMHGKNYGLGHLDLSTAITILFPWYYSKELVSVTEKHIHNTWTGGWLGLMPVWLSIFALLAKEKNKISYFFLLIAGLYLLKVFGFTLINWIGYLPIFSTLNIHLHITQNIAFPIAVLCGLSTAKLLKGTQNAIRFLVSIIPIIIFTIFFTLKYPPSKSLFQIFAYPAGIFIFLFTITILYLKGYFNQKILGCGVIAMLFFELIILIPIDRLPRGETFSEPPYIKFLKADPETFRVFGMQWCLFPNTATAFELQDIGIYEGLFVNRFSKYIHELVDNRFFGENSFCAFRGNVKNPASRFLDLLNLKYLIIPNYVQIPEKTAAYFSLKKVYAKDVIIYQRQNVLPRALIRHNIDIVPDESHALALLKNGYDILNRAILNKLPKGARVGSNLNSKDNSKVIQVNYSVNRKSFWVEMDHDGFLIINDVNYPGWKVKVDGKNVELLNANYLFQGVYIPAGNHKVDFVFRPNSFMIGLIVSILTFILLASWIFIPTTKRQCRRTINNSKD